MKPRLALAIVICALAVPACDDDGSTTPTPTRIIGLSGNMNFGNVLVGSFTERTLTIANSGNNPLSVTGVVVPSGYSTNFAGVSIQPGSSHPVTVRLTPSAPIEYAGIVTVTGDQTSGNNSVSITGMGVVGSSTVSGR